MTKTTRQPFRTPTHAMGVPLVDIDNIAEALAYAEDEDSGDPCPRGADRSALSPTDPCGSAR